MKNIKRMVVKVGSSSLTYATGNVNLRAISRLCEILADIKNSGVEIILVSSGAIAVGVGKLGLKERPKDVPGRQAAAAVGQCELMFMYDKLFSEHSHKVAQVLLTRSDVEDPERHENLVNTFSRLLDYGCIPVVNENDTVGVEEIVYGDNDCLSANVAVLAGADTLVILSDIDGMYTGNPKTDPSATLMHHIPVIDESVYARAGGAGSAHGTGGMYTKVKAADIALDHGINTYIINGTPADNLYRVVEGEAVGTLFGKAE